MFLVDCPLAFRHKKGESVDPTATAAANVPPPSTSDDSDI